MNRARTRTSAPSRSASRTQEYGAEELLASLLERAEHERVRLEEAGEIARVADEQPEEAPRCDNSLVGAELEICWRYWVPYKDASGKQRRKGAKMGAKMWCLRHRCAGVSSPDQPPPPGCLSPTSHTLMSHDAHWRRTNSPHNRADRERHDRQGGAGQAEWLAKAGAARICWPADAARRGRVVVVGDPDRMCTSAAGCA